MAPESVWDYPRPPAVEPAPRVLILCDGQAIVDTDRALRVLETSHPPTIYVPPGAIAPGALRRSRGRGSICEWKGQATYWDVLGRERAAWSYAAPWRGFEALRDFVSFYPSRMDECRLAGEEVDAQAGDFYGGWVTSAITGPFKGGPGTLGW